MNDLFSGSFSRFRARALRQCPNVEFHHHRRRRAVNLDKFFEDVEAIKDDLRDLETLYHNLQTSHEQSKTLHSAKAVKDLRSPMDNDVASALKKAKLVKVRLEALDRNNAANRSLLGAAPATLQTAHAARS
ncbi:Syntaxin-121 [Camellia lanceoleosa]|uniref:Syntaxin-121 n=1 Tax=Camellia lanceoleosa TaxID=1840588 RepID=A0ACC0FSF0_9ERIC|nr:Syntaxin-121 [Camellia lanceoleosa]